MIAVNIEDRMPIESVTAKPFTGTVHVWSVIHQATPYVEVPYIAAIIDLDGGGSINTNIVGIEPKPENMQFGMKVKMFTEKVSEDKEGNSYVAYKFRPI